MERTLNIADLDHHTDRLYRAALRLCRTPHDAEDLVQETYARLLSRPRRIRGQSEHGYLLAALRNTYLDHYRARSRRPAQVSLDEGLDAPDESQRLYGRVRNREVLDDLRRLPDELAAAIVAVDVVGLPAEEAARSLGIERRTLNRNLARARTRVARQLGSARCAATA